MKIKVKEFPDLERVLSALRNRLIHARRSVASRTLQCLGENRIRYELVPISLVVERYHLPKKEKDKGAEEYFVVIASIRKIDGEKKSELVGRRVGLKIYRNGKAEIGLKKDRRGKGKRKEKAAL